MPQSPSPSPSPSPKPLSAFEGDPAVMGLRTYRRAVAAAVNAKDLQLRALVGAATARRNSRHQSLYGENIGLYYPGPNPLAVLGVRVVSPTSRTSGPPVVAAGGRLRCWSVRPLLTGLFALRTLEAPGRERTDAAH